MEIEEKMNRDAEIVEAEQPAPSFRREKKIKRQKPEDVINKITINGLRKSHSLIAIDLLIGREFINSITDEIKQKRIALSNVDKEELKPEKKLIKIPRWFSSSKNQKTTEEIKLESKESYKKHIEFLNAQLKECVSEQVKLKRYLPCLQQNISKLQRMNINV